MRVLGIDPGTRVTGYGVLESEGSRLRVIDYGVVRAPRGSSLPERLRVIHDGLRSVISKYEPDVAAVEGAFFGVNARTAIKIGEGRGVALLAAATGDVEVVEYPPATVKKAVTGTGRAHKTQVQQMVRLELELPEIPEPNDAADALALAICHCHRERLGDTVGR